MSAGKGMLIRSSRAEAAEIAAARSFLEAGADAAGEFACKTCGYGVAVRHVLPVCPMCRGVLWEPRASALGGRARF